MRAERRWRINCNRSFSSARKMRRAVRMMRRTRFGKGGPRHGSSRIGNGTALRARSHGDRLPGPRFAQGPEAGRTSSAVSQQREKRKAELCGAPRTQRKVIHILTPSGVRCEDCCLKMYLHQHHRHPVSLQIPRAEGYIFAARWRHGAGKIAVLPSGGVVFPLSSERRSFAAPAENKTCGW